MRASAVLNFALHTQLMVKKKRKKKKSFTSCEDVGLQLVVNIEKTVSNYLLSDTVSWSQTVIRLMAGSLILAAALQEGAKSKSCGEVDDTSGTSSALPIVQFIVSKKKKKKRKKKKLQSFPQHWVLVPTSDSSKPLCCTLSRHGRLKASTMVVFFTKKNVLHPPEISFSAFLCVVLYLLAPHWTPEH